MDANSKAKITRNFLAVKERISVDVDFFVDRMIETGIFTLGDKAVIAAVLPPTSDKRADVFITKLIRCGNRAFEIFKEILQERGFTDIIELMENTGQEYDTDNGASGYTEETGMPFDQKTTTERMPTDKHDNLAYMNALLAEHMKPITQAMTALEKKFEASEEARDAERKLYQEKWEADRKLYEERTQSMHKDILKLQDITEDLQHFREMYQYAREQLTEKKEKCYKLFRENKDIKKENIQIKSEIDALKSEYDLLNNAQKDLHAELDELASHIKDRENEIERLRNQMNKNYSNIQQPLISIKADIPLYAAEGISNTLTNQTNTPRKAINNKPKKGVCRKANISKK